MIMKKAKMVSPITLPYSKTSSFSNTPILKIPKEDPYKVLTDLKKEG